MWTCSLGHVSLRSTLHLNASRSMNNLASKVTSQGTGKKDIRGCHLDRHPWPLQGRLRNTQTVHCFGGVSFCRGLKGCPSMPHMLASTPCHWANFFDLHDSRGYCVHPNPLWCQLLGQTPCECRDSTLRRAIIHKLRVAHVRSYAARVDDAASSFHMRQGELGHGEHTQNVCTECLLDHG